MTIPSFGNHTKTGDRLSCALFLLRNCICVSSGRNIYLNKRLPISFWRLLTTFGKGDTRPSGSTAENALEMSTPTPVRNARKNWWY